MLKNIHSVHRWLHNYGELDCTVVLDYGAIPRRHGVFLGKHAKIPVKSTENPFRRAMQARLVGLARFLVRHETKVRPVDGRTAR